MAGVIHLVVVPSHWAVSAPMSAFFLGVGVAQLVLAAALGRGLPDAVLVGVISAHLAIMGLYVASRTVDLPFVPPHDAAHEMEHLPVPGAVGNGIPIYPGSRVEPVGVLDAAVPGRRAGPGHLPGRAPAAAPARHHDHRDGRRRGAGGALAGVGPLLSP